MARFACVLLLFAGVLSAATLKKESVDAWKRYVDAVETNAVKHAQAGETFLWLDESKELRDRVRSGEIVVAETKSSFSRKAPSALIHDWTGAAFLPGARIEDVVGVVRDYERYREYYSPTVIRSKAIERTQFADHFSVVMMNSSLIGKTALETECNSTYNRLGDKRWYAVSEAVRVQEIENFGRANEHRLPAGQGGGYIWRLATITRFEEREGGVYMEVEALALSRDIPASLRFMVDPIVRRVSRNSLTESLRQTGHAVVVGVPSESLSAAVNP